MKLLSAVKDLLMETIPFSAIEYDSFEDLGEFHAKWYITQHALGRTTRSANLETLTMDEIEEMCNLATPRLISIFTDKKNPFKPHPGFHFQVRQQGNLYATLGCVIDSYENLKSMTIVIKTTLKSGNTLKSRYFDNKQQMIVEI